MEFAKGRLRYKLNKGMLKSSSWLAPPLFNFTKNKLVFPAFLAPPDKPEAKVLQKQETRLFW